MDIKREEYYYWALRHLKIHFLLPLQDDKLSYDEVLAQFDVLVDSPLTDYGHAVHEELWSQPAANYGHCTTVVHVAASYCHQINLYTYLRVLNKLIIVLVLSTQFLMLLVDY